eukprot:6192516-Pleurochrysis_carterae.AAC.2
MPRQVTLRRARDLNSFDSTDIVSRTSATFACMRGDTGRYSGSMTTGGRPWSGSGISCTLLPARLSMRAKS